MRIRFLITINLFIVRSSVKRTLLFETKHNLARELATTNQRVWLRKWGQDWCRKLPRKLHEKIKLKRPTAGPKCIFQSIVQYNRKRPKCALYTWNKSEWKWSQGIYGSRQVTCAKTFSFTNLRSFDTTCHGNRISGLASQDTKIDKQTNLPYLER